MTKKQQSVVSQAIEPMNMLLETKTLFATPVEHLSKEAALEVYTSLDVLEKRILKARKDEIKKYYMDEVLPKEGTVDKKGSYVLELEDGSLKKQRKQGKTEVEPKLAFDKFKDNDIVRNTCFKFSIELTPEQIKRVYELLKVSDSELLSALENADVKVNEKAFDGLLKAGIINQEEANEVSIPGDISWSFTTKKPKSIKKFENLTKQIMVK